MPTIIEPDSTLLQSSKSNENNAVIIESQEKGRKEDDVEDEIATITGRENDTETNVAQERGEEPGSGGEPEGEGR